MYDPVIDEWTELGDLDFKSAGMGIINYNGFIYLLGGWEESGDTWIPKDRLIKIY